MCKSPVPATVASRLVWSCDAFLQLSTATNAGLAASPGSTQEIRTTREIEQTRKPYSGQQAGATSMIQAYFIPSEYPAELPNPI